MPRRKKIPDLSSRGEVGDYISPEDLKRIDVIPRSSERLLDAFAYELNTELDELQKDLTNIRAVRKSKASNPKTKFDSDIRVAANELATRIQRAPAIVSSYTPFVDLVDQLQRIDEWLEDAEADSILAGLADRDPYRMKERGRRLAFIAYAHTIYHRYTDGEDWANKNHSHDPSESESELCSNLFFRLMRICLTKRVLGKPLSQSTIEKDIGAAKKVARAQIS